MESGEITVAIKTYYRWGWFILLSNIPKRDGWTEHVPEVPDVFPSQHCWTGPWLYQGARHPRMSEN